MHEEIYQRFGVKPSDHTVKRYFFDYLQHQFKAIYHYLLVGDKYDPQLVELYKAHEKILHRYAYQTHNNTILILGKLSIERSTDFHKGLVDLQILINLLFEYDNDLLKHENKLFIESINSYIHDNPSIGIYVKSYKTFAPKIFISVSKETNVLMEQTLDILESKQFENTLNSFTEGMNQLMAGKGKEDWKNVIEDMCSSCDEVVKEISGHHGKSFKDILKEPEKYGLNGVSKEIFKHVKNWMDGIKHGSDKDYERKDAELAVNLTLTFIQHVAKFHISTKG